MREWKRSLQNFKSGLKQNNCYFICDRIVNIRIFFHKVTFRAVPLYWCKPNCFKWDSFLFFYLLLLCAFMDVLFQPSSTCSKVCLFVIFARSNFFRVKTNMQTNMHSRVEFVCEIWFIFMLSVITYFYCSVVVFINRVTWNVRFYMLKFVLLCFCE